MAVTNHFGVALLNLFVPFLSLSSIQQNDLWSYMVHKHMKVMDLESTPG